MPFTQLTNAECGQSNSLMQMVTHLTQDRSYQDRIGNVSTLQCPNDNYMPPQTFRMKDLLQEINGIESQGAVGCTPPPSVTWATQDENQLTDSYPYQPRVYENIPQAMYLSQSHSLGFPLPPPLDEITQKLHKEIDESLLGFTEISACNKAEYKVIKSIDELVDCVENNKSPKVLKASELAQESRSEERIDEKVKIINSDDVNRTREDYKSKVLTQLLRMGKMHLSKGERSDAIACFTMVVLRDETCFEAWKLLGIIESENIQDDLAIFALLRGLQLEPQNLEILMTLASVYSTHTSNKFCKYQSLVFLSSWLKWHPEYKYIIPENFEIGYFDEISTSIKVVQDMFIRAARRRPIDIDYQVQSALGILFNLSDEYDKVIDCYRSALQARPQDARLWNQLGVAVSKLGKYEEGMELYQHALSLDSSLTCCYYNIGMTHMKMKAYREAAEQFLIALNLQARFLDDSILPNYTSEEVWLRFVTCLSYLDHSNFKTAVLERDLEQINKEFGVIKI